MAQKTTKVCRNMLLRVYIENRGVECVGHILVVVVRAYYILF